MTRYGFAIKALPSTGKPFDEDDEEELPPTNDTEQPPPPGPDEPAAPTDDPTGDEDEPLDSSPDDTAETADTAEQSETVPPEDDSRPWGGDLYNEGDESDPDNAFAGYSGSDGEQAWLDRATDGTLTGWVRDSTGQVWRYSDPDAWATDVDGAQMTRTHGPDSNQDPGASADPAPQGADDGLGAQDPLFASQ
ncbi:hypothetical protein HHL19_35430 [Streptomyces sp. R302]|uniref:hypothetical protein n=1 Tax=unclassified Streptomyces TaxID=2593676 RepID=UPI00145F8AE2|nr:MULTISPECIES: hypothetical protein [unclassified Streptomyces]NML55166.1 hypothetical protein [Streptomyces sp. R301]NML83804.1 hypothetical protein [Streptomyces sp. R302]